MKKYIGYHFRKEQQLEWKSSKNNLVSKIRAYRIDVGHTFRYGALNWKRTLFRAQISLFFHVLKRRDHFFHISSGAFWGFMILTKNRTNCDKTAPFAFSLYFYQCYSTSIHPRKYPRICGSEDLEIQNPWILFLNPVQAWQCKKEQHFLTSSGLQTIPTEMWM